MSNDMTIPVTLRIYKSKTGVETIIPDEDEIAESLARIDEEIADLKADADENPERAKQRIKLFEKARKHTEDLRDHFLPETFERTFELRIPSYHEELQLKSAPGVRITLPNGLPGTDDEKFMDVLLPKCVVGKTEAEVRALRPAVARQLYWRLRRAMDPTPESLFRSHLERG